MKLKLRFTLVLLLVVLVGTSVVLEGVFSYVNGRHSADDLSAQVLEQTSDRIDQQIGKLLGNATSTAALSRNMLASGQIREDDFPGIIRFWQQLLAVNTEITSLYIGLESTGECTGVSRLRQGKFTVWESRQNQKTRQLELKEYWLADYPGTPYSFAPDKPAPDIRTRPWYIGAKVASNAIWTETFSFLGLENSRNIQGVTYAIPFYTPAAKLKAVVSVDFDLGGLNRFLQTLQVGRTGFAFIVELRDDGTRRVIAYPSDASQSKTSAGSGSGALTDPRVTAFMAQIPGQSTGQTFQNPGSVRFSRQGSNFLGRYNLVGGGKSPRWLICTVLPEGDVMDRVYQNNRNTIVLGFAILCIAVSLSLYIAGQVARPLERISTETQRIGLLRVEPHPVAHSMVLEVDRLAVATEEMKTSLRSFQKYVPVELVRSLLRSGEEARLGGQLRTVTVYFSDIVNFSTIAETLPPEQLVEYLGDYLHALSQPITATGGTVDKYIGDAIMAFWGAPEDHPSHASAACMTALQNQSKLAELRHDWTARGRPPFYARIGLNTGDVVVGNVGSASRFNYTVIGDAVNIASRLEGLNKYYGSEIIISESTYLQAQTTVTARPLDWVSVKGKTTAVLIYELLGQKRDENQLQADVIGLSSQALTAYRNRKWDQTISIMHELLKLKPNDCTAVSLLKRCREYQAAEPDALWDGVHHMQHK